LYILRRGGEVVYLLDYVDDMLIVSPSKRLVSQVKQMLSRHFEMTDLGPVKKYLGWHVRRDRQRRRMWLSVEKKIIETVRGFGCQDLSPTATPLPSEFQTFFPHEMDKDNPHRLPDPVSGHAYSPLLDRHGHTQFRQVVGSLQYFAQSLRPDVRYAANALAQVAHCPRERHWKAALHCLRYLSGTAELSLCYSGDAGAFLQGYSDSDFAGCAGTRKSTTGWVFLFGGSPVGWQSKKQEVITLSSCEAEYRALTSVTKEAMWLRQLLAEFGFSARRPTPIYCDNEAAVRISRDPVCRSRTRHVALSFLFVRQEQAAKRIIVIPIRSAHQIADYLTKPVTTHFQK
jgi:hypothetical protein